MRFLPFIALLLFGCSSSKSLKVSWNSRAQEQERYNAALSKNPQTREQQILTHDPNKEFNLTQSRLGSSRFHPVSKTNTGKFHFVDRVRVKKFGTQTYRTQGAWMGDYKYETKSAPVKDSWFSRLTARTKTFDTRESSDANKVANSRAFPGGDRAFSAAGRRQAEFDREGAAAQAPVQSWAGDLRPLTIEDIKQMLNKN